MRYNFCGAKAEFLFAENVLFLLNTACVRSVNIHAYCISLYLVVDFVSFSECVTYLLNYNQKNCSVLKKLTTNMKMHYM